MNKSYDVVVIGSGPGGYVAAIRLAQLGKSACIVEQGRERIGGVCLNEGCIPTKALINSAGIYDLVNESSSLGLDVKVSPPDMPRLLSCALDNSSKLRSGIEFLFKKNKIDVILGRASLASNTIVQVEGQDLSAQNIIIATGSRPKVLTGLEPDGIRVLTSSDVFKLKEVPKSLLVIGAGAIGIEFGSLFSSLGSKVTIVEALKQVLPLEDKDVALEVTKYLKKKGIEVLTASLIEKLEKKPSGCSVSIKTESGSLNREFEYCLLSIGRSANIEGLGLEKCKVLTEKGFIKVNELYQTSVNNIYAVGDCINTPMLAHIASAEAIVAAEAIAGKNPKALDYDNIPSAVYSEFQVARVGLTESSAREKGMDIVVGKLPFRACGKAVLLHKEEGFVKIVSDKNSRIIGVHIAGHLASELIHEFVLAKSANLSLRDIANTVHSHPTLSEIAQDAAKAVFDKPIHG